MPIHMGGPPAVPKASRALRGGRRHMVSLARQRSAAASASRSWVERLWSSIAERGQSYAKEQGKPLSTLEQAKLLAEALLSERGEASGAAVARELHAQLRARGSDERVAFYRFLAEGFVPDPIRLRAAATAYIADPTAERAAPLAGGRRSGSQGAASPHDHVAGRHGGAGRDAQGAARPAACRAEPKAARRG